jgi:hypothetical protein
MEEIRDAVNRGGLEAGTGSRFSCIQNFRVARPSDRQDDYTYTQTEDPNMTPLEDFHEIPSVWSDGGAHYPSSGVTFGSSVVV